MIKINDNEYELIINKDECFDEELVKTLVTDYFDDFDYISGDYAYDKLRLKGFYEPNNKAVKEYNDYNLYDKYLKEQCAYGCRHFVLHRQSKKTL